MFEKPDKMSKSDDVVTSNFLTCKVDANLSKEEQKKVVQSVELTKALVLMGYQTWSALEPGKFVIIKSDIPLIYIYIYIYIYVYIYI